MAGVSSLPAILAQIRNRGSSKEQVAALRALKNDIIGHPQRKEAWIVHGVLEPLVQILSPVDTKIRQNEEHDDEPVRLQAACIVASLAYGGPSLLRSSHAASILPAVLSNLCPTRNSPRLVLATLQALSNLAGSLSLSTGDASLNLTVLADNLLLRPNVNLLYRILSQPQSSQTSQSQLSLVTLLISTLCREERHQVSLTNSGALDALATKLAEVVVAQGMVIPGVEVSGPRQSRGNQFSLCAASPSVDLVGILEAISVIIAKSKFRASQLVYSEAICAVFPMSSSFDFGPNQSTKAAWSAFNTADISVRQTQLNAIDHLIPQIPANPSRASSGIGSAFPPLGTPGSFEHIVQMGRAKTAGWPRISSFESGTSLQEEFPANSSEPESPLIAYLIWLARSRRALERLAAISVLTVLYRAGLANKSRENALGLLVVPLLVQLLEQGSAEIPVDLDSATFAELQNTRWSIQERAPAVLAMLIVDSEYLQKSAYDAGVIGNLTKLIKFAYEPVPDTPLESAWSPTVDHNTRANDANIPPSLFSTNSAISPTLMHKIKVRESALRAIAALVPFKDEYRKALIDQGVVPYLVESLRPLPNRPSPKALEKNGKGVNGSADFELRSAGFGVNPVSVLIAACGAVRHLSRSVSILRTTLIDNGVVMPVFDLLQHSDIEVQIAATAAVCNFVTEFSPMREIIAAAGVLKVLCEHAHSGNVKLRLNALWALKHLVHSADNEIKKTCLEELGQGWLVQLICDNTEDEALSDIKAQSGVGLTDELMDDDMQVDQFEDDEDDDDEDDDLHMAESLGASASTPVAYSRQATVKSPSESHTGSAFSTNTRLAALQELETNPARRARKDDIAVQEQGLEFIRNLIGAANTAGSSETSEMIDFLFNALGQDQIFEILASKLRPKVTNAYNKRGITGGGEPRIFPPQAEIVTAVGYILVHMAASVPRHRQLLISQTELLKLLVPLFNHPNKEVRVALCWLATNLTWIDDIPDHPACAQRARELKRLGFLTKLESLEHDSELDVRERAKVGVYQFKQHGC